MLQPLREETGGMLLSARIASSLSCYRRETYPNCKWLRNGQRPLKRGFQNGQANGQANAEIARLQPAVRPFVRPLFGLFWEPRTCEGATNHFASHFGSGHVSVSHSVAGQPKVRVLRDFNPEGRSGICSIFSQVGMNGDTFSIKAPNECSKKFAATFKGKFLARGNVFRIFMLFFEDFGAPL